MAVLVIDGLEAVEIDQQDSKGNAAIAGIEGCLLRTSVDYSEGLVSSFGVALRSYAMPNDPGLVGQHLYFQYFGASSLATTTLGVIGSNAVDVLLGN